MEKDKLSFDYAFYKVVVELWPNLPKEYRAKYASARSKHFNASVGIGDKKKRQMLIDCGFENVWTLSTESQEKGSTIC